MSEKPDERRIEQRHGFERWAEIIVLDGQEPVERLAVATSNLSRRGVRLRTAVPLKIGATLLVVLDPHSPAKTIIRYAIVRNIIEREDAWNDHGIEFWPLPDSLSNERVQQIVDATRTRAA